MTSPQFPGTPLPTRAYTASTVFELQNADQESQAHTANTDLFLSAEDTRQRYFTGPYAQLQTAGANAATAVTASEEAANAAAAAGEKADIAYENAHYWSVECVVASAAVVLGVNELLLGPVLNVPDGLEALLTDVHFAFISQPGGCTIEVKRWNAAGTVADVIHTQVLGANVTRYNANALAIEAFDKERFFYNVTSVTGSTAPTVLQINVSGVYIPEP